VDEQRLLDELLQVASRLGIAVRVEHFETPAASGGGLCAVQGRPLVLLDASAPLPARVLALARALAGLDVDAVHMAPAARELIETYTSPISTST
jgi:hypothetical protein